MATGTAWRAVSNMTMVKKTVTSGMAWRPVSHRVSPKGVFGLFICNLKLVGLNNYLKYT